MSNLIKLECITLDISRKSYLPWRLNTEIHLDGDDLGDTIKEGNKASNQENAKVMIKKTLIFLHQHLHESLKNEFLAVKDPLVR